MNNIRIKRQPIYWLFGNIKASLFLFQANYLNENYYQDIIDERNCVKLCGYALCSSVLNNVPKQQYHISTTQKKVFDITERKVSIYFACKH